MLAELQNLYNVWNPNRIAKDNTSPQISFDELTNSIINTGWIC